MNVCAQSNCSLRGRLHLGKMNANEIRNDLRGTVILRSVNLLQLRNSKSLRPNFSVLISGDSLNVEGAIVRGHEPTTSILVF